VSLIADRYQPLEQARAGAPQRARDLQTAQSVWLRSVAIGADPETALARALAAKGIFHPSLVTLFDVLPQGHDRALLAYEYVPAQTVAQVSGGLPLNPRRAAEILTELGDAVAELHSRNIAHGGITDRTVLITMKGKAKLDRVGDPSLDTVTQPSREEDMQALGELLHKLVGKAASTALGAEVIEAAIEGARKGTMQAATFAALLRR
jgi:serine/threonine protein kinase